MVSQSPENPDERSTTGRNALATSLLVATCYVLAAFSLGSAFPFFPFDMFSFEVPEGQSVAGPLLVERDDGSVHRVVAFTQWRCDLPPETLARATCDAEGHVDFRWRRMDHRHLTQTGVEAATEGSETVQLIRRGHPTFSAEAPERCAVATCQAVFTGGGGAFYGR